eukprot:CAMPEP_0117454366 /NCGR_PEP_ID=MMETSP0759-20121206/10759_1 /TAXON_ID=63605 /ORGANISM="Percolomonas cosmopolitus, Strain WS" /LENGTH=1080 /DNA_ID=CAMNT_0005247541 /DNA_START=209 /DNA_END=3452 /DNA_ORIENTATION=-
MHSHASLLLFCIIFVLSVLCSSVYSTHISCREGEVKEYEYHGATILFEKTLANGEKENQKIITKSLVKLTCLKHFEDSENEVLLWWIRFSDLEVSVLIPKTEVDDEKVETHTITPKHPDLVYAQDRRGKVYKVIKSPDEDNHVAQQKKNFVELLQSKLEGSDCADRDVSVGTIRVCYKRTHNTKINMFLVEGDAEAKDIITVAEGMGNFSPRKDTYVYDHDMMIDGNGIVHSSMIQTTFGAGGDKSQVAQNALHTQYDDAGTSHAMDGATSGTPLNGHSISRISLHNVVSAEDTSAKQYVSSMKTALRDAMGSLSELMEFVHKSEELHFDDLHISTDFANELNKKYKAELEKNFNFWGKLGQFKDGYAKDTQLYSQLFQFISVAGVDYQKLYKYCFAESVTDRGNFDRLFEEMTASRPGVVKGDFSLSCQGLLTADNEAMGQELLLESMHLSLPLFEHGLIQILTISKPIGALVRALVDVQNRDRFRENFPFRISEEKYGLLQHQSYLVLAGVARTLPRYQSRALLKMYMKHFSEAIATEDQAKTLFVTRALQNLGDLVPHTLLHAHARDPTHDENIKTAFVEALSTHTSPETHEEVTNTLAAIALSADLPPSVRAAAVLSQTTRERNAEHDHFHGSALDHYALLFENPNTPQEVAHAVHHYLQHEGSEDAVRVLTSSSEKRAKFDPAEYVTKVLAVLGGEERAKTLGADGIKNALQAIQEGLKTATFESMTCLDFARNGDELCAKKPEMVQFLQDVRRMGNLQVNGRKGDSTIFETLFGVNAANVYLGFTSGSYTGVVCNAEDASVSFAVFARAHVQITLFNNVADVIKAYGYLILSAPEGQYPITTGVSFHQDGSASVPKDMPIGSFLHDHVYFGLGKFVLVDTGIIPAKVKEMIEDCEKNQKILVNKVWKDIVSFQFNIPLGPYGAIVIKGGASASFMILERFDVCPTRLRATYSIAPRFTLGASLTGQVSILIFSVGATVSVESVIELNPVFGLFGCKLCAILKQDITPLKLDVDVNVMGVLNFKVFSFTPLRFTDDIIHICAPLPGVQWAWWENDPKDNAIGLEGLAGDGAVVVI